MAITLYLHTMKGRAPGSLTVDDQGVIHADEGTPVPIISKMATLVRNMGVDPAAAATSLDGWSNGAAFISVDPELRVVPPGDARRWDPGQHPRARDGKFARVPGGVGEAADVIMKNREGFSVSLTSGRSPETGYMVAQTGATHTYPQDILDDHERLAAAIEQMILDEPQAFSGPETYLGGWVHDGKLWLEPSDNVASRQDAVDLAARRNQIAIWDVSGAQEIGTGGSGGGRITEHDAQGRVLRTYTEGDHGAGAGELPQPAASRAAPDRGAARVGDPAWPEAGPARQVAGLDWDAAEYELLRAADRFDPAEHPRKADGEFARKPGGAATAASSSAGAGAARVPGREPTVAELAAMVNDLRQQLAAEEDKLEVTQRRQLAQVSDELRREQANLIELSNRTSEVAGAQEEHHKAVVRSLVTVLGLVACGLLIIATAGTALPALAVAGISVGPLLAGEAVLAVHDATKTRSKVHGRLRY